VSSGTADAYKETSKQTNNQTENIMSTCTYNLTSANCLLPTINAALIAKRAKNVALFFLSPFIGLAYLIALPFVGFGMLAWVAAKAVMKSKTARPVAMVITAPVIALMFVTAGPIVALVALAAMGAKAALNV
jgi:hypothetical protein